MKTNQRNTDLSIIYNAALLITDTPESAERLVASAYASTRSQFGSIESDRRLKLVMRESAAAARKLTLRDSSTAPAAAIVNPDFQVDCVERYLRFLASVRRAAVVLRDVVEFSIYDAADVPGTTPERFRQYLSHRRLILTERMN